MKLIFAFIAITLQVSAAAYSQQITLNFKNARLFDVMRSISQQSDFDITLPPENLNLAKPVTINIKKLPIEKALQIIFEDQPAFQYIIENKAILVRVKPAQNKTISEQNLRQVKDLIGKVQDQDGKSLVGATVYIKENNKGAITNQDGEFIIKNAPDNGTLIVTMIGHETRQFKYLNSLVPTITLKEINADLAEVQVVSIPYGQVQQRYVTSNMGVVTSKQIERQPVSNPLLALQGRVPGLFIEQTSGSNMSSVNVMIQGKNSMQNGSTPFYVIDGVPYPEFTSSLADLAITGQGASAFSFLNPADIESITILKDADATSIYGSRAANGAILITTKKGKAGKTRVDVNMQSGWGKITRKSDMLNTQQYLELRKEAFVNSGQPVPTSASNPASSNYDLTIWDQNKYTDWQEVLVGGTAQFQNLQASLSGGSQNTQFLAGYGFNRQTTVYPNHLADLKGNLHFNVNHSSNNTKFKYQLSGSFLKAKNQNNNVDLMDFAQRLAPNAPELYNPDGSLNYGQFPNNPNRYSFDNPLAQTLQKYVGNTNNLISSNTVSYEVLSGLQLKASAGYNLLESSEIKYHPITSKRPDEQDPTGSAEYMQTSNASWIIEPQLTYFKDSKIGTFDVLVGSTFQQVKSHLIKQAASGFTSDNQLDNITSAPISSIVEDVPVLYKYSAVFGRLNYRLTDKYILNLSARRDGSSRFGDLNKFNTFYAIGGAWLFVEEEAVKRALPVLTTGKLRVSYGTTGNDQIQNYQYLSLLDNYYTELPYQGSVGLYPSNISNQGLQWEETKKFNVGLDLGFFTDRLLLSANWFRNRSSNQLISYSLPISTGFVNILRNFPATVQNTGFEITLEVSSVKSKNFTWQSSVNMTIPKNKLIAFDDLANSSYSTFYEIGKPINLIQVYKFAGVNPTTGLYEYFNSKGEKTSQPNVATDKTGTIDPNPKFYGGFSNTFQYKGIALDFLFQFVNLTAQNNRFGVLPGATIRNQTTSVLDRWRSSGDMTNTQKASFALPSLQPGRAAPNSDAAYGGSSYIRLKNISLSFSLPNSWLKNANIGSTRLFIQGQNLLTFTDYIGNDPETRNISVTPPLKMFTAGVQVSL